MRCSSREESRSRGIGAPEDAAAEFLAGTDGWFRPVQVRTGPDGALWVVDMYRLVIEHPQWIPPADLARLDVLAGHANGRIYRIYPTNQPPRPILHLDRLGTAELVAALDSPNGPQRDLAQQMLVWKDDPSAVQPLERLALAERPEARLHALCTLDGLHALRPEVVLHALADPHPGVRRHAVRLAAKYVNRSRAVAARCRSLLTMPMRRCNCNWPARSARGTTIVPPSCSPRWRGSITMTRICWPV